MIEGSRLVNPEQVPPPAKTPPPTPPPPSEAPRWEPRPGESRMRAADRRILELTAENERLRAELAEVRMAFSRREEYLQQQVDGQHASARSWQREVQAVRAEYAGCDHLHVTGDDGYLSLACFTADPDSEHGDTVHQIDAGDSWGDLLTKVTEHRCAAHNPIPGPAYNDPALTSAETEGVTLLDGRFIPAEELRKHLPSEADIREGKA